MSIATINWALSQKCENTTSKTLLLALANFADDRGLCWPGQALLAELVECSVDTIQRHLARLEAKGLLSRHRRKRENGSSLHNEYRLMLDRPGVLHAKMRSTVTDTKDRAATRPSKPQDSAANQAASRCGTNHQQNHQEEPSEDFVHAARDTASQKPSSSTEEFFERFWKAFPAGRKKAKGKALADFRRAIAGKGPYKVTPEALIAAAEKYAATKPNPQYVPLPSTWLNQCRWLDELEGSVGGSATDWRDEKRKREAEFAAALYGRS